MIKGVGHVNTIGNVAMTCAKICGIQLAIVDVSAGKPLFYQFAWKVIKFIKNKKAKNWMRDNSDCIAHLPMVFMAKIHQLFQLLASFLQNLINTNKIEVADDKFDVKNVTIVVKLVSKFFSKMQEHGNDNSIPKNVPAFARSFFSKTSGVDLPSHRKAMTPKNQVPPNQLMAPAVESVSQMAKSNKGRRSPRKSFGTRASRWACFMSKRGLLPPKHCLIRAR
jgi:hypothetical protein